MGERTISVNTFTNGILGPSSHMLGPVQDGGYIVANTAPGCWGPMLTPGIRGGHEVAQPVAVEGAQPGDAIAIRIVSIHVTSQGTASGNDRVYADRCLGDPYVAGRCPKCGTLYPPTHLEGTGPDAVRCDKCGAPAAPFAFTNGYTIAFDEKKRVGITLNAQAVKKTSADAYRFEAIPDRSQQNPVAALAPSDIPGLVARVRPFVGQLGTLPVRDTPDSHNARDFGAFLVNAPHEYGITADQLKDVTDGHMDINRVRPGAVLIAPVRLPGGGVYVGDMHAMQGNGEIAGHTCDVSGIVTLQVSVIKGLALEGPLLLPTPEDLPYLAKPLTAEEEAIAQEQARQWDTPLEKSAPIGFVGTGENMNKAIDCALERAAHLLDMTVAEVMNRTTITGELEIGRAPGTVTATFKAPVEKLQQLGLYDLIATQYDL